MVSQRSEWHVPSSNIAQSAHNPIRQIVDKLKLDPQATKSFISLSVGDPTVFGNFNIDPSANEAVIRQLHTYKANGYGPAHGTVEAREAVAKMVNTPEAPVTANDILLANGCSGALDLCVNVLGNPGQNILLPRPGFSLYGSLAAIRSLETKYYNLLPEENWQIDLAHMESLIDENTCAILVNNPSNPCGSVYSREHLQGILQVAAKHHVPIIADEIYCDLVFKGNTFYSMASLTTEVPILSVGGLAKKWLVPGWRIGWIVVHDRNGIFDQVREGLLNLSQVILGPNSVIQAALPDILHETPQKFYDDTIEQLEKNTKLSMDAVSKIPGLNPVQPQGAMYMMVGIDVNKFKDISSDVDFSQKLLAEESVLCLPGECFTYPNYIRIVITPTVDRLEEAYKRMAEFCARHLK
ncbi:tyrosine aminotransferase [Halteromyces radiatus]|uniref:tyrosine aminotransferase n=1 Tax=Halteromyces radiatus TaxID=101107 RepID=UPI00222031A0|nr:tyrosine aminotransferase [Halteromyces radiatus]KAI8089041.1 tyrosine aminotransferase [Halteromyces radiatus]